MDNDKLWQTALGDLEVSLSKANYTTWFKGSFIYEINGENAIIGVPNNFSKEWLKKKFHPQIIETLRKLTNNTIFSVEYVIKTKNSVKSEPDNSPLIHMPVDKNRPPVSQKNNHFLLVISSIDQSHRNNDQDVGGPLAEWLKKLDFSYKFSLLDLN